MNEMPFGWEPASREDAALWPTLHDTLALAAIIASPQADAEILRGIAAHPWTYNDRPKYFLPKLADSPNLTDELLEFIDERSAGWDVAAQHGYWARRYQVDLRNSNYTSSGEEPGPVRSFPPAFTDTALDCATASAMVMEFADHFAEQLWYDLAEQGHLTLDYQYDHVEGDKLRPLFRTKEGDEADLANEEILDLVSPGYFVSWIDRVDRFDAAWARDRAQGGDAADYFTDQEYLGAIWDDPLPEGMLGYAIAAGVARGDVELVDAEAYDALLEAAYEHDETMLISDVILSGETPWEGPRYKDLDAGQQMRVVNNLLATLDHPYLGREDGLTRHFLACLAQHDRTAADVRVFMCLLPIRSVEAALRRSRAA